MADHTSTTVSERLRYVIEISKLSQAQFAHRIGIDPSNLSKYLLGRLPINDTLINRVVLDMGVSRRWLRDGIGTPYDKDAMPALISPPEAAAEAAVAIPVYDIDVTAGATELSRMFTDDRIIGRVQMPRLSPDSCIVHVSGDSMEPVIRNGAYINIRPVNPSGTIFWGQIYVVILDDYRMVKYVRRHTDPTLITLHSANTHYDDIDLPRNEVRGMYIVEAVLNFDIRV